MATTTASPPIYDSLTESPLDQDDVLYPCKGCGEILEEGKAFELAGNRWHIECFRCNTCGTLLDSDANLLLLGDGSLICNNCTYSCNACGNKIEDLAILTGDQAFCASCFRCRNCKRKIENLRYARTSQGIFCMSCHEALMARRRKKSRTNKTSSTQIIPSSAPAVLDKSLPALPSTADAPLDGFSQSDSFSRAINDPSSFTSSISQKNAHNIRHDTSPPSLLDRKENLTLPSSTYSNNRLSNASSRADAYGDDDFFIPVALDPSPGPHSMPTGQVAIDDATNIDARPATRDYFVGPRQSSAASFNDPYRDMITGSSRSASAERSGPRVRNSPHIAYQEKGRQHSSDVVDVLRKRQETGVEGTTTDSYSNVTQSELDKAPGQSLATHLERNESTPKEPFKLQDAPKWRGSSGSKRSSDTPGSLSPNLAKQGGDSPQMDLIGRDITPHSQAEIQQTSQASLLSAGSSSIKGSPVASTSLFGTPQPDRPKREDSLKSPPAKQAISRKEVPRSTEGEGLAALEFSAQPHERQISASSPLTNPDASQPSARILDASPPIESFDPQTFINSGRSLPPTLQETDEDYVDPRNAPPPPPLSQHQHNISMSSIHSDLPPSTPVPGSTMGDHPIDSESSRNVKVEDGDSHGSILRRVSNAVKHGRSLSDRGAHGAASPKWSKSARNGSMDISSPIMGSPDSKDDVSQLRNRLRFSQQRVAELEAEKNNLLEQVNGTVEIKQVNTELREKRSTMAFLDTQKEMVVRELEVLTEHLQHAKETDDPVDIKTLKSEILKDFANSLQKLKDGLGTDIEDLMHQKNQLTAEISNLIQMKDKGFQEFENLTTKNTQLADLNNQLVHSIQELYKQGRQTNGTPIPGIPSSNGLGIYSSKERSEMSTDYRSVISHDGTASQLSGDTEVDPTAVLTAPQVVNIRKGQPKKFNWKKGGHAVAKNVTKGFKGAFGGGLQNTGGREDGFDAGLPYGSMSSGPLPTAGGPDQTKQGWSFLTQKVGSSRPGQVSRDIKDNSVASLPADALFGSELEARAEFEKRVIPHIVTTCIAEVETRGMSAEGIYRKSGSTSLVNTIKLGFENSSDYDVSDPDLDIHAVTSALKQYFRKLPTPLITYDCYDGLLEAAAEEEEETRAENIREAVESLPRAHRDCLEFLVFHLVRVMEKEPQNLMTPHNLAVIFAPTIMRPVSIEREMSDMQAQRTVVLSLIQQNKIIFGSRD